MVHIGMPLSQDQDQQADTEAHAGDVASQATENLAAFASTSGSSDGEGRGVIAPESKTEAQAVEGAGLDEPDVDDDFGDFSSVSVSGENITPLKEPDDDFGAFSSMTTPPLAADGSDGRVDVSG